MGHDKENDKNFRNQAEIKRNEPKSRKTSRNQGKQAEIKENKLKSRENKPKSSKTRPKSRLEKLKIVRVLGASRFFSVELKKVVDFLQIDDLTLALPPARD